MTNEVSLGHVLRPEADLGLPPEKLDDLDVAWTDDRKVVVIYLDKEVKAVIVHDPHTATTGRGVRMHDDLNIVNEKYDKTDAEADVKTVADEDKGVKTMREVRRYDALGDGFEMLKGKVVSITLYPAKK